MNVIIGWFLIIIAISVFLTFVLGYDLDLKDKIICVVSVDAFVILLTVAVYLIAGWNRRRKWNTYITMYRRV